MTTIEKPKKLSLQERNLLETTFRYSVMDLTTGKERFQNKLPSPASKYWSHNYVIWDNKNKSTIVK